VFSQDDGECTCLSGYIFYDDAGMERSEGDSDISCQRQTVKRCKSSEVLFGDRTCVNPGSVQQVRALCASQCQGAANVVGIDTSLGICRCDLYRGEDEVCDASCRASLPYLRCTAEYGQFELMDSDGTVLDTFPSCDALQGHCTASTIITASAFGQITDRGETVALGLYPDADFYYDMCSLSSMGPSRREAPAYGLDHSGRGGRVRRMDNSSTAAPTTTPFDINIVGALDGVPNPLICIAQNEALIFQLNPSRRESFPRYVKDHLLNTNPAFDYGAFRRLASLLSETNVTVNLFVHQFSAPGTYVFADNSDTDILIYVRVVPEGSACGGPAVAASTASALTAAGASTASTTKEPDWTAIGAVLGVVGGLVLAGALVGALYRPKRWAKEKRANAEPEYHRHAGLSPYLQTFADALASKEPLEVLEGFSVKTLYDKLDLQALSVSNELERHDQQMGSHMQRIETETSRLKDMVASVDLDALRDAMTASGSDGAAEDGVDKLTSAGGRELNDRYMARLERETALMQIAAGLLGRVGKGGAGAHHGGALGASGTFSTTHVGARDPHLAATVSEGIERLGEVQESQQAGLAHVVEESLGLLDDSSTSSDAGEDSRAESDTVKAAASAAFAVVANDGGTDGVGEGVRGDGDSHFFSSEEDALIERLLHERLGENHGLAPDSAEYMQARREAEAAVLRIREEAQRMHADILRQTAQDSKRQHDLRKRACAEALAAQLRETAVTESGAGVEGGKSINASEADEMAGQVLRDVNTRFHNLRKQARAQLEEVAAERRRRRKAALAAQEEKEVAAEVAALESSAEFRGLSSEDQRRRRERITQRARQRAAERERAADAQLDNQTEQAAHELLSSLQQREIAAAEAAAAAAIRKAAAQCNIDPEAMIRAYEERRRTADAHIYSQQSQQEAKLKERMQQLKARRQKAALQAVQEVVGDGGLDGAASAADVLTGDAAAELEALEKNQARIEEEMRERHVRELASLTEELETEAKRKEEGVLQALDQRKQQLLQEKRNRLEAELAARPDLGQEEIDRLLAEHDSQMQDLGARLNSERARQHALLRERMLERKRKRREAEERRQRLELEKERVEQQKEAAALRHDQQREAERTVMMESIQAAGADQAEQIVTTILHRRQGLELSELRQQMERDAQIELEQKKMELQHRHEATVETLQQKHHNEINEFMADMGSLPTKEADKLRRELEQAQAAELADAEEDAAEEMAALEAEARSNTEIALTEAQVQLKERHYHEYAEALRELTPDGVEASERAEAKAAELESLRAELEQQRQEQLQRFEEEQRTHREEQERLMREALEKHQRELRDEEERETARVNKEMAELAEKKARLREEGRKKKQEQFAERSKVSETDTDAVLSRFELEQQKLSTVLEAEKLRQDAAFKERLALKRRKRRQLREREIQRQATRKAVGDMRASKAEADPGAKGLSRVPSDAQRRAEALLEESQQGLGSAPIAEEPETEQPPAKDDADGVWDEEEPLTEDDDGTNMHLTSDRLKRSVANLKVYDRLAAMEALLQKRTEQQQQQNGQPLASALASKRPPAFSSPRDAALTLDGDAPQSVSLDALTPSEFLTLHLGLHVARFLAQQHGFPAVRLQPASLLPRVGIKHANDYYRNAFRRSVLWQPKEGTLYIRREYLGGMNDLLPVLIHTMAHLKVDEMARDDSPEFLGAFHEAIGLVAGQLLSLAKLPMEKIEEKLAKASAANERTTIAEGALKNLPF
jgi:hypothetical protein